MPDEALHLPLFDPTVIADAEDEGTLRLPFSGPAEPHLGVQKAPPAPTGSGRLVRAAWPLIAFLARLAAGSVSPRPDELKGAAVMRLREFEQTALQAGALPRQVALARYVLCTAIDEAVLTTSWGAGSEWTKSSLLAMFHGETWGGEKVFLIIDRALEDRVDQAELLELCHLIMVLGFQGRYRRERDGTAKADAIRGRLFEALRSHFGDPIALPKLVPQRARKRSRMMNYVPVLSVALTATAISVLLLIWFNWRLDQDAQAVAASINRATVSNSGAANP
jgi:type VI secretion system protein ImpK